MKTTEQQIDDILNGILEKKSRPHSNSIHRSKLVTAGERHRRRSDLIVKSRSAKAGAAQVRFIRAIWHVLFFAGALAGILFMLAR